MEEHADARLVKSLFLCAVKPSNPSINMTEYIYLIDVDFIPLNAFTGKISKPHIVIAQISAVVQL